MSKMMSTLLGVNFGGCVMMCFQVIEGASYVHRSWEARKGKKHGQIRLRFCYFVYILIQRTFLVFCRTFLV